MNLWLVKVSSAVVKPLLFVTGLFGCGCGHQLASGVDVSPRHFKVQTPFILDKRGVIINTYWGRGREHHVLCLDNNSPSWVRASVVHYTHSLTKSTDVRFKTLTADGSPIEGEVALCDSLFFGEVTLGRVPFYVMPEQDSAATISDGVLGLDAMEKGIWKIDFKKEELTFVSELDSLTGLGETEIFPASFTGHAIEVEVDFGEGIVEKLAVDLGYNRDLLLPMVGFQKISRGRGVFSQPGTFSTPGSHATITQHAIIDTVNIGHDWYASLVSSHETVTERLLGLSFFRRFSYVIFDFVGKRIYVPKKVW